MFFRTMSAATRKPLTYEIAYIYIFAEANIRQEQAPALRDYTYSYICKGGYHPPVVPAHSKGLKKAFPIRGRLILNTIYYIKASFC